MFGHKKQEPPRVKRADDRAEMLREVYILKDTSKSMAEKGDALIRLEALIRG